MDEGLITLAIEEYLEKHYLTPGETRQLTAWYPIKAFQKNKYQKQRLAFFFIDVLIIPSEQVTSIVVAPRESN